MKLPKMPHTAYVIDPAEEVSPRTGTKLVWTVPPATETPYNAWLQQDSAADRAEDGRDPSIQVWTLIAIMNREFTGKERVRALGMTFEIFGIPEHCYTLRGYHHTEMKLKRING